MDHSYQRRRGVVVPEPCPHLADFRSRRGGAKPFRALQECLRVRPPGRAAIRRDPNEVPRCASCGSSTPPRLYACVACAAISCHSHAASHAAAAAGHEIAVDVDRAELFCCLCRDQVYDRDFDAAVVLAQTAASTLGGGSAIRSPPENLRKRRRVDYRPWSPDVRERALVGRNSSPLNRRTISGGDSSSSDLPWGLRGLNNLGNTCFMNSVLQAFLHTPPLRNYFLSDRHNRYFCQQQSSSAKKNDTNYNKNSKLCLACDMDAMYSAVFSGDRKPYSPAKFLYSWWLHAANLASYEQQDAHEIFISMLDGIHEKVEKDKRKPHSQGQMLQKLDIGDRKNKYEVFVAIVQLAENTGQQVPGVGLGPLLLFRRCWQVLSDLGLILNMRDCHLLHSRSDLIDMADAKPAECNGDCCIAHRVFCGILRSDVMCTACGFTSTTYDPCVDISLDLEPSQGRSGKTSTKSFHSSNTEADSKNSSQNSGISTLMGCLDRFTRPERLGSDQKFFCQQCQVRQESLKQMSIRKLPLVSCFHIKRFEHSPIRNMSRKVDRYLQFPFSLDMAPYLSSSILRSRYGNRIFSFDGDERDVSSELSSEFELFAVITHTGKLDAGHYVTYLRLSNQWYKCDDAWVTRVNENIVRAAQGYMMFYVQKMLYYKASERPVAS